MPFVPGERYFAWRPDDIAAACEAETGMRKLAEMDEVPFAGVPPVGGATGAFTPVTPAPPPLQPVATSIPAIAASERIRDFMWSFQVRDDRENC